MKIYFISWSGGLEQKVEEFADKCSKIEDLELSLEFFAQETINEYPVMKKMLNSKLRIETETMFYNAVHKYFENLYAKREQDYGISSLSAEFFIDFFSHGISSYLMEQCINNNYFDVKNFNREIYQLIVLRLNYNKNIGMH